MDNPANRRASSTPVLSHFGDFGPNLRASSIRPANGCRAPTFRGVGSKLSWDAPYLSYASESGAPRRKLPNAGAKGQGARAPTAEKAVGATQWNSRKAFRKRFLQTWIVFVALRNSITLHLFSFFRKRKTRGCLLNQVSSLRPCHLSTLVVLLLFR